MGSNNYRLQEILSEVTDISRIEMTLYDNRGRRLVGTEDQPPAEADAVREFAESDAESQNRDRRHFFKVMGDGECIYVLTLPSEDTGAYLVGRLAVSQIRTFLVCSGGMTDKNTFIRSILTGNMLAVDINSRAEKLKIKPSRWMAYVIEARGRKEPALMEAVKGLSDVKRDFVTELDERSVILIKDVGEFRDEEEEEQYREIILSVLHTDAMVKVRVGSGNPADRLSDIARSYQEASMALKIGEIFYAAEDTLSYRRLGIGRLIFQLPRNLCEMFIREVFGASVPEIDEETLSTVNLFFDNSLNISETARQLYVHRNTLVYRLDRFQKLSGLDVRVFEDAVTFKIAMMVLAHLRNAGG